MLLVLIANEVLLSKNKRKVNGLVEKDVLQFIIYKNVVSHYYHGEVYLEKQEVKQ